MYSNNNNRGVYNTMQKSDLKIIKAKNGYIVYNAGIDEYFIYPTLAEAKTQAVALTNAVIQ